jgi:teichuronic acid exporter
MSIKVEVLSALRWSAAGRLAAQLGSWVVTIYVIRILDPADYGLMGMASILIGLAALFNELGVIPALIQTRNMDERLIQQLFGLVLTSTTFIFCLLFFLAPLLSAFFNEPRLTPVTRALAVTIVIGGASAVQNALLERNLQFRGLSVVEFASTVLGSGTTLLLAVQEFGVWSLVIGNIVSTTAKTIGIFLTRGFPLPPVFRLKGLRSMFVFGANITGQRVLWYLNSSVDVVLVGKLLGDHALGVYSVAFQLANLPVSKAFSIVNRVAFPAYAKLQNNNEQVIEYFIMSVQMACLIFFPVLWGMSSVSEDLVSVFMGEKWQDAVIVLKLIPLMMPLIAISGLMFPLTDGLGRPDIGLRNLLTTTTLIPVAILIGTAWDLTGVCVALIIARLFTLVINFRRTLRMLELCPGRLLAAVAPSAISAGTMYAFVVLINILNRGAAPGWRLPASIVTGMLVYSLMTLLINRNAARQCLSLLRMKG